ncbi:YbhB/YbcL family Raf kinase inhibitor-like protein [Pleurocapsales cyanobacterium LEGE 06147]|nr:YbhB/YbcL family Raf kinase inhibitor-like protein [Pleurocapsales cyanobacterium LEGE 06147]
MNGTKLTLKALIGKGSRGGKGSKQNQREVVYNLPRQTRSLPENVFPDNPLPKGGLQGINDFGQVAYGGPWSPGGTHRYFFKLYALERVLELKGGATKAQLEAAMKGHILAQAELIGRYRRQR